MDAYHHGNLKADLLIRARVLIESNPGEVGASLLEELMAGWESLTLEEIGPAYLGFFRRHPSALGLVFGPRLRKVPRIRDLQDQAYATLVERLPPGSDGQPNHTAGLAVWALVQGLAHLYASGALGADPVDCPGGPDLWYQEPAAVMTALAPLLEKLLK